MKLTELNSTSTATRALKEHFQMPFNTSKMSLSETRSMLTKVRGLIAEARTAPTFYKSQHSPSYLKMVFMEQALTKSFNTLRSQPQPRIVVENEEVEKSQVVLAAQDMVDSVQKMLEQVSDMMVKEMPALIDSVQSEIGVNEAEQFSTQTTEALGALTASLTQTKTALQGALNVITGQGASLADPDAFDAEGGDDEFDDAGGEDEMGLGNEEDFGDDLPPVDDAESEPVAGVGRARR